MDSDSGELSEQKLATLGLLTGSVAHDFNNLLTAILGYTELLSSKLEDEKLLRYAGTVHKAAVQASEMVRRVVNLSAPSRGEGLCKVNRVLFDTEGVLARIVGGQVDLLMALDPRVGVVVADPVELQQIVLNLVVNARDAMDGKGIVGIESSCASVSEAEGRALQIPPGSYVVVRISDMGKGMDPDTLARVFEPFFTTKGEQGTGLGLATVKRIAERWGGGVEIESSPGEGTSIAVYLRPPAEEISLPVSTVHKRLRKEPGGRSHEGDETILVVEDDPLVYSYMSEILGAAGYRILGSTDPLEALEIAVSGGHRIDLLVTDLEMHRLSGVELKALIEDVTPEVGVLFVSGTSDPPAHGEFLSKPFDRRALLSAVRSVLRPKRLSAQEGRA